MRSYRILEQYTADVGLECRASSLKELLKACIEGFLEILYGSNRPELSSDCKRIELAIEISEFLVVDFLDEALYLWQIENLLLDPETLELHESSQKLIIRSRACRPLAKPLIEIKAVTYHDYIFNQQGEQYYARVVFDI